MSLASLREFQNRHVEQEVAIAGSTWRFRRSHGAGPALLLLPGAQGTGDMFYQTALDLGERLDVVTVTCPDTDDCDRMADELALLLDALSLPRANLLGSSLGGYIAQLFALKHAGRIETLFLANTFCDAGVFQSMMPSPEEFARLPADAMVRNALDKLAAMPEPEPAWRDLKAVSQALIGPAQTAETLKLRWLAVLKSRPVPRLPLPPERIVMIDDDEDPVILPPMRAAMRAQYAGAEHHAIAGGGHYPGILRPDAYAGIIRRRLLGFPHVQD